MVEVFKTNVCDKDLANAIVDMIHKTFEDHRANFDLDDCDHILRVETNVECIEAILIIALLQDYGCHAEILEDEQFESFTVPS
jgi:hypothetical protein